MKMSETNSIKGWLILLALGLTLVALRFGFVLLRPFAPSLSQTSKREDREASLGGVPGKGLLIRGRDTEGETKGLWHAETSHVYETLHALYQSHDRVLYRGYVYDETTGRTSLQTLQVVISSWARQDHPDSLELHARPPRRGASRGSSVTLP